MDYAGDIAASAQAAFLSSGNVRARSLGECRDLLEHAAAGVRDEALAAEPWSQVCHAVAAVLAVGDHTLADLAIAFGREAANQNPERVAWISNIAGVHLARTGKLSDSLEHFEIALLQSGVNDLDLKCQIQYNLAAAWTAQGQLDKARRFAKQAEDGLKPTDTCLRMHVRNLLEEIDATELTQEGAADPLEIQKAPSLASIRPTTLSGDLHEIDRMILIADGAYRQFRVAMAEVAHSRATDAAGVLELITQQLGALAGADHPLTVAILSKSAAAQYELALALEPDNGMTAALERLKFASTQAEIAFGRDHLKALAASANFLTASLEVFRRQHDITSYRRTLEQLEGVYRRTASTVGEVHRSAILMLMNLASAHSSMARADASRENVNVAIVLLEEASSRVSASYGAQHPAAQILLRELNVCRTIEQSGGDPESGTVGGIAVRVRAPAIEWNGWDDDYVPFDVAVHHVAEEARKPAGETRGYMQPVPPSRTAASLVDEPVVEDEVARPAGPPATRRARRLANRIYALLAEAIDRRWRWDRFPTPVSLALIKGICDGLREHNLFDTNDAASTPALPPEPPTRLLVARSVDGSYNDLSAPAMGMANTRFGRNVPLADTEPEDAQRLLTPNPRLVSTRLLARGPEMIPARGLNVLAAAWLQFETRDWFSHGTDAERPFEVPRPPGDDWPTDPIEVPRTKRDPNADGDVPRTFVNTETHWWDASQIYGSNQDFQKAVRRHELGPGKVAIGTDGLIDIDPALLGSSGGLDGWWVGLELLHTLFMREHNAVCDMLAAAYPAWSDDELFDKGRLIIAALIAKIHTVEWTTAILNRPALRIGMRANWFGLAGERVRTLYGRLTDGEILSGIPGSPPDHHSAPYSITEEFVAVYRMHPLIPEELHLRSMSDPRTSTALPFMDSARLHSRPLLEQYGATDLLYSLGTANPGAVTLHNHPRFMQRLVRIEDGLPLDLAAVDLLRSRERGVPRYNDFRRLMHLPPVTSFEQLTGDPQTAAELRAVYPAVDDVDLTVGLYAETPPAGFGFSDTTFRIFILMASRRLKSDRFFTTDFTPQVYTPEGMAWIEANDMRSVLLRHYPRLAPALRGVRNAFAPWPVPGQEAQTGTCTSYTAKTSRMPVADTSAPAHYGARGAALDDRARFWLYRNVVALKEWREFRATEIIPLAAPADGRVQYRPFAEAHPGMPIRGLHEAMTFPKGDHAEPRLRRIRFGRRALDLLTRLAPKQTPPVPRDIDAFLSLVYPLGYRRAWPTAPAVPPELAQPDADVLAELAVRAPFGSYLRRSDEGTYAIDLRWMNAYPAREGLARPGGLARFAGHDRHLTTVSVQQDGVPPRLARAALLAGLNEDLTTFRHNLSTHLTTLTSFALATTNELDPHHPVRRLLHHCFHTVLIGNLEVAEFQIGRPRGFSSTIFSHQAPVLVRMANDHVARYDFWDLEPDTQFARRGTTETPFAYPYRDNVLRLWTATVAYVEEYLRLYYADDAAVTADAQLTRWTAELDHLLPNGVTRPDRPVSFRWLTRLCATLIHISTVEHDVLNNIVWNYSTLGWIVPTVAPLSGQDMDQRRAFDLIATIIGTWKPYNMLLTADIPKMALDPPAAAVMQSWIDRLAQIQQEIPEAPSDLSASRPQNLNVSISN